MQLIYIYVKSFRNFSSDHPLSLPLTPCYDVSYSDQNGLSIRKKPGEDEKAGWIFNEKIQSVHAIVGRNAVGKTNIADLIAMPEMIRTETADKEDAYFLVYADAAGEEKRYYIEIFGDLERDFPRLVSGGPQFASEGSPFVSEGPQFASEKSQIETGRWYSGYLSQQKSNEQVPYEEGDAWLLKKEDRQLSTAVISMREFVNKDLRYKPEDWNTYTTGEERENEVRQISGYRYGRLGDQFRIFPDLCAIIHEDEQERGKNNLSANALPFDDREYKLALSVTPNWKSHRARMRDSGIEQDPFWAFDTFRKACKVQSGILFVVNILCAFIDANLLTSKEQERNWISIESPNRVRWDRAGERSTSSFNELLKELADHAEYTLEMQLSKIIYYVKTNFSGNRRTVISSSRILDDSLFRNEVQNLLELLNLFGNKVSDSSGFSFSDEGETLMITAGKVPAAKENIEYRRIIRMLNLDIINEDSIFEGSWHHISDGERQIIQGYASLYRAMENRGVLDNQRGDRINCILLLDEPELHMHPELARSFLYIMTKWLGKVSDNNTASCFQLLIFTHSPFLLSDLDRDHVIHLQRKSDGHVELVNPQKQNQTFAANIHDILQDTLFLDHSCGQVAYSNLRILMEELTGAGQVENKFREDDQKQRQLLNMIGDPILRSAFLQAYRQYQGDR